MSYSEGSHHIRISHTIGPDCINFMILYVVSILRTASICKSTGVNELDMKRIRNIHCGSDHPGGAWQFGPAPGAWQRIHSGSGGGALHGHRGEAAAQLGMADR